MAYADHQMKKEKYSPDVHVGRAKKLNLFPHEEIPCTTTLYNYIDLGLWKQKILTSISRFGGKPTNRETDETKKFLAI